MLNILKRFGLEALEPVSAERFHLQIEAQRLAYEARDAHVADPDFADVAVDRLLSDDLADALAARIDPDRALADVAEAAGPVYRDTVYIAVADGEGRACSFINSLYFGFGAGIADASTGVIFQNRGAGFTLTPGHPNRIAGGKRPLHTIIPALAFRDGALAYCFGVMGGAYQPVGHVQILIDMEIFGRDPQEALDGPRLFHVGGRVECERSVPEAVREGLARRGHAVAEARMPWGGGQIVGFDRAAGSLIGASDPRKDGCALGF
jgi:gamma-glutamyltranspeptidase/glutathione hydrolase